MDVSIIGGGDFAESLKKFITARYGHRFIPSGGDLCCVLWDAEPRDVKCGCILLPGEQAKAWAHHVTSACAVTYGAGNRDSITFSSTMGDTFTLALQRGLKTPSGALVDSQEIPVPMGDEDRVLACAGALLLCGESPETLCAAMKKGVIFHALSE